MAARRELLAGQPVSRLSHAWCVECETISEQKTGQTKTIQTLSVIYSLPSERDEVRNVRE
jgi:hypothetical protein